jgi:hypothetical protein
MVDIDRLLKEAKPYPVKKKLEWLRKEGEKVKLAMAKAGRRVLYDPKGYADWYKDSPNVRKKWKVAGWEGYADPAEAAREFVRKKFDRSGPWDWLNVDKDHQIRKGDWLLCFNWTKGQVRRPSWLYIDRVVPVRKSGIGRTRRISHCRHSRRKNLSDTMRLHSESGINLPKRSQKQSRRWREKGGEIELRAAASRVT